MTNATSSPSTASTIALWAWRVLVITALVGGGILLHRGDSTPPAPFPDYLTKDNWFCSGANADQDKTPDCSPMTMQFSYGALIKNGETGFTHDAAEQQDIEARMRRLTEYAHRLGFVDGDYDPDPNDD